ncbi:MAG: hypothetical protein L6R41_000058 [Letrouitia leprolyta]|nr:MAG: hypothetical protein L6R41_000058 [Letrouitia leprolyta]
MDIITRPLRSSASSRGRRDQENTSESMKCSEINRHLPDLLDRTTSQTHAHLAQLLREAHAEQKRNTRTLEESYHSLRKSTRLLESRWKNYCTLLEQEINAPKWKDNPRQATEVHEGRGRRLSKNPTKLAELKTNVTRVESSGAPQGDAFFGTSSPKVYHGHSPLGESTGGRPRSNAIHRSDYRGPPAFSRLSEASEPSTKIHNLPSPLTASRASHEVRIPNGFLKESETQSPTSTTTARYASLPTQEQLVALSERSRQYLSLTKPPATSTTSPTLPRSPQTTTTSQELHPPVMISDFSSPVHRPTPSYSHYRPQQVNEDGAINFSLPHAQVNVTKKQEATRLHGILPQQSKTDGHWVQSDGQDPLKAQKIQMGS